MCAEWQRCKREHKGFQHPLPPISPNIDIAYVPTVYHSLLVCIIYVTFNISYIVWFSPQRCLGVSSKQDAPCVYFFKLRLVSYITTVHLLKWRNECCYSRPCNLQTFTVSCLTPVLCLVQDRPTFTCYLYLSRLFNLFQLGTAPWSLSFMTLILLLSVSQASYLVGCPSTWIFWFFLRIRCRL